MAALPVIEKDICYIPAHSEQAYLRRTRSLLCSEASDATYVTAASGLSSKLSSIHYLQYFLYNGMIYLGLKNWQKALHNLEAVISAPSSNSASVVMSEAYKKWVLANLLSKGKVSY
jgi:COP9 signalosome complex subunit 3